MDILSTLGLEDIDAATFTVAGAVFVAVELAKLVLPAAAMDSPRGARLVRTLPLLIGAIAGVCFLRVVGAAVAGSVVVPPDAILSGLRRGLAAGAIAMGGWEIWRITGRAIWRGAISKFGSAARAKLDIPDPKKPLRKRASKREHGRGGAE